MATAQQELTLRSRWVSRISGCWAVDTVVAAAGGRGRPDSVERGWRFPAWGAGGRGPHRSAIFDCLLAQPVPGACVKQIRLPRGAPPPHSAKINPPAVAVCDSRWTGGTDWATLGPAVAGALGVGSFVGSVVSTYGGKGRDRRKARSRALNCLEKIEITRRNQFRQERQLLRSGGVHGALREVHDRPGVPSVVSRAQIRRPWRRSAPTS
jgi:hypothetical protein